jgi:hypothetical protein
MAIRRESLNILVRVAQVYVCRRTNKMYVDAAHSKSALQLLNSVYFVGNIFIQKW